VTTAWAACPAADPQQIRDAYATWLTAYRSHDLAGVMAIFDEKVYSNFRAKPIRMRPNCARAM
jgi:ketosteroid isomerase-like protein